MSAEQTEPKNPPTLGVSLLEDNAEERSHYERLLNESAGFRCLGTYDSVVDALSEVPRVAPAVLLVDIRLAGENRGIDFVREIKQRLPRLPVLMLTAFEDGDLLFASLRAGAVGYLLKRDPPERLLQSIRDAARGEAALSGVMARKMVEFFRGPAESRGGAVVADGVETLSEREHQVLALLAQGRRYKEIAEELDIADSTLRTYVQRVYEKLHVHSRTEAAMRLAGLPGGRGPVRT